MLQRTEGIVLRTIPFGEADLIVTYITPDFGLLKVFAKSPRKVKSRFGSSLEPLTHSKIAFWGKENTALPRLTQSDIMHSFHSIRDNLNYFLKVSEIIELTLCFIPERDVNRKVYSLLLNILQAIENNSSESSHTCSLIANHYKIKFLEFVGFAPKLDACGRCGKNGYCFYISHGSILCEDCAKGVDSPIRLSPAVLKLYNDLLTWDTAKIKRIKPTDMLLSELSDIMNLHIKYILDKPLKSETHLLQLGENN
jgi:DNA repair protein RecO (recombination protein O)